MEGEDVVPRRLERLAQQRRDAPRAASTSAGGTRSSSSVDAVEPLGELAHGGVAPLLHLGQDRPARPRPAAPWPPSGGAGGRAGRRTTPRRSSRLSMSPRSYPSGFGRPSGVRTGAMDAPTAELSSLATALDELTAASPPSPTRSRGTEDDLIASELFEVERSLGGGPAPAWPGCSSSARSASPRGRTGADPSGGAPGARPGAACRAPAAGRRVALHDDPGRPVLGDDERPAGRFCSCAGVLDARVPGVAVELDGDVDAVGPLQRERRGARGGRACPGRR